MTDRHRLRGGALRALLVGLVASTLCLPTASPAGASPSAAEGACDVMGNAHGSPAQLASVSSSYTAAWNNIAAVKDGAVIHTGGQQSQIWGTYSGSRPEQQWLQYEWSGDATLISAEVSFWRDTDSDAAGNGVAVPASWKLQTWTGSAWADVPLEGGAPFPRAKDAPNKVTFASPVVTTRLRAIFTASSDGTSHAAVGVSEFALEGDAPQGQSGVETLTSGSFNVAISRATGGIYQLTNASDAPSCTNYVMNPTLRPSFDVDDSRWTGDLEMKVNDTVHTTGLSDDSRTVERVGDAVRVSYDGSASNQNGIRGFGLSESYELVGEADDVLDWNIQFDNPASEELRIRDLGVPMLMNSWWNGGDQKSIYEQNVARHSFVAEDGSYVYWSRPNGTGPFLVMVPKEGTSLEFRDKTRIGEGPFAEVDPSWEGLVQFNIHSETKQPDRAGKIEGDLPATSGRVAPGASKSYGFTFRWADDYSDLRDKLYEAGVVDAVSLPGMVIPQDQTATLAVRAKGGIEAVSGQEGREVSITAQGSRNGYLLYDIAFGRTGPSKVVVTYAGGRRSVLQYNSIAPIDELVRDRAKFLVQKQQARDADRGYDGAFLQWDMSRKQLVTWHDYPGGGWKAWMAGGSDDAGLSPAVFLSEANVQSPSQAQVNSLDYYLDRFIWNYMQNQRDADGNRTYRIYHWYDGSDGDRPGTADGLATWRVMNYPHVWNTYFNMYKIAKSYPSIDTELSADEYLLRAYNTMRAYFEHPNVGTLDNASREMGSMGEMTMPDVIEALADEGHSQESTKLESYVAAKGHDMLSREYPFASEMSIDTTAFEATYTLAKRYGNDEMVKKTTLASLAARGLQPLWYYYGSDNRHMGESWWNLGYETQLGAWQQQDYLRNYDASGDGIDPDEAMRSTYGAFLGGWSNINTGQISDDPANFGAASWQYQSQGGAGEGGNGYWGFMPMLNKWWAWSGEADLGFWGGLKTASVNVVDDDVVGTYAYGGQLDVEGDDYVIVPKDGVRTRLAMYNLGKFGFELTGAKYTSASVAGDLSEFSVRLQNEGSSSPGLAIENLPSGEYEVLVDDTVVERFVSDGQREALALPAIVADAAVVDVRRVISEAPSVVSFGPVSVTTTAGTAPMLPSTVVGLRSDGSEMTYDVQWDAVEPSAYASPREFEVSGTVSGSAVRPIARVSVATLPMSAQPTLTTSRVAKQDYGQTAKLHLGVTPAAPGQFVVSFGNRVLRATASPRGVASIVIPSRSLLPGSHDLDIRFVSSDERYESSQTSSVLHVMPARPNVRVIAPRATHRTRAFAVKVTVSAKGFVPDGKVKVSFRGKDRTARLRDGRAVLAMRAPARASGAKYKLTVTYLGGPTTSAGSTWTWVRLT